MKSDVVSKQLTWNQLLICFSRTVGKATLVIDCAIRDGATDGMSGCKWINRAYSHLIGVETRFVHV